MKARALIAYGLLCALASVSSAMAKQAPIELEGTVERVVDGDTFTLRSVDGSGHRVRLEGIDAPELQQPFGKESAIGLRGALQGRLAVCRCSKRDRHGRLVCRAFVDADDIGLQQIRSGRAWHFRRYSGEQPAIERESYASAEAEARDKRRGLWATTNPEPPWFFRERSQSNKRSETRVKLLAGRGVHQ